MTDLTEAFWPADTSMDIWETSVGALLRKTASENPDASALVEITVSGKTGRRWTYAELLADAEAMAHAFATRFEPGEKIVVWSHNLPEWVLIEYAAGLAGLVVVTANPAFQESELRYVLEQSGASGLFRPVEFRGNPMAEIAAAAVRGLDQVREVIDMENHAALLQRGERPDALPDVQPGDAAQIQYTSGTTGFPKGAVLAHRGLINNARYHAARWEAKPGSIWLNTMPMFHTSGCGMATLGSLQCAGCMVLVAQFDPALVNAVIEQERINFMTGVPTMILAMVEAYEQEPRDFSSIEALCSGGSMVPPELVRRARAAFDCELVVVYGQTEFSPLVTQQHRSDAFEDICETIGRPVAQTDVSIRRVADNTVADIGETGEICARGCSTMIGYNDNPEATAATIDADGWLHTGDLGTMDARGYLRITGRVKEMIIRGGENFFPAEIENAMLEHPDIAVVGLPDEKWGEIIAAFYRSESGADLPEPDLRRHCRERLAPQKTSAVWRHVREFPLTGSGKIQKFALRENFLAGAYGPTK
jgi:fatty-acyl-CoA synthase